MTDSENPTDQGPKHKLRLGAKRSVITLAAIIVVLAALFIYLSHIHDKPSNVHASSSTSNSSTKSTATSGVATTKSDSSSTRGNKSTTESGNTAPSSSPTNATTTGPCSSVLTADQAKSVLGGTPSPSSSNGTSSQTADITVITCAYSNGSDTATVIEHKANTPTGQHENDDQFGSARPSGVATLNGYGQSAYWQPSTGINVLQANNWYVVSFSDNNGSLNESRSTQLAKAAQL